MDFTWICTDLSMDLRDNIPIDPVGMEVSFGTEPFTCLGQGFQTNLLEIPFQKGENLSIYGQNYGHLRHFHGLSIAAK